MTKDSSFRDQLSKYANNPQLFRVQLVVPSAKGAMPFGECIQPFQRRRFRDLEPALLAVAKGEKPEKQKHWWEATKGSSKDSDLAIAFLWLIAFSRRMVRCQIGAADRDQADEMRLAAKAALQLNPWLNKLVEIHNWQIFNRRMGSSAEIVSADISGSHGARPDVLVLNELTHITKDEFAKNLMDNATKVPRGVVIVATNAGVLDSWQWQWRQMAMESDRWTVHVMDQPAPWLSEDELDEARKRNSRARFLRLWNGVWTSGEGDALDEEDIDAAFAKDLGIMAQFNDEYDFIGGGDLSITKDFSAFVVVGKHMDGRYRVARCWIWRPKGKKIDQAEVERTVIEAHKTYNLTAIGFDDHQAEYLCSRLSKQGLPVVARKQTTSALVEQCVALLEQFTSQNIDCCRFGPLERDLRRLMVEEKSYGMRLVSPRGAEGHGDTATALSIALALGREFTGGANMIRQFDPTKELYTYCELPNESFDCEMADGSKFTLNAEEFQKRFGKGELALVQPDAPNWETLALPW